MAHPGLRSLVVLSVLAALLASAGAALALPERVSLVTVDTTEDGRVVVYGRECTFADGSATWLPPECDDGSAQRTVAAGGPFADQEKTYYNYWFYGVELDRSEPSVTVYRMWCSGYGGVANQPDPMQDCHRSWDVVRVAPLEATGLP